MWRRALLAAALAASAAPAASQDAGRGRALYAQICAVCHADPPGSGSVNPLVRTPEQIRAALVRVSPMRYLSDALTDADLADIASYFVTILGAPSLAPAFGVSGQWANPAESWWVLYVTQYAGGRLLTGAWLTFDAGRNPTWIYFYEGGGWTAPGVYVAKLYRNSGPGFAAPPGEGEAGRATEVGSIALVFSADGSADVTFVLQEHRITHKIRRTTLPP